MNAFTFQVRRDELNELFPSVIANIVIDYVEVGLIRENRVEKNRYSVLHEIEYLNELYEGNWNPITLLHYFAKKRAERIQQKKIDTDDEINEYDEDNNDEQQWFDEEDDEEL